jgi:hypothetical protein
MDEQPDPVTRLGPDSGGRPQSGSTGAGGPASQDVKVYTWEWGPGQARRPGLPWIGIFLLTFGGLLLLQQVYPQFEAIGSIFILAIGLAFLIKWAIDRGTGSLYAGALITALAAPEVINALGYDVDGLGTFCFGLAFLFIAAVRVASGGGWGWQAVIGGLLALLGLVNMTTPDIGGLVVPLGLLIVGAVLVFGGLARRDAA